MTILFRKISQDKHWVTIPNILTFVRILLAPIIVLCMYKGFLQMAFLAFIGAAVTDLLDGLLARWCDVETRLGKMLDPVADKILLVSLFCALAFLPLPLFQIPVWFFGIVFIRETIILLGTCIILLVNPKMQIEPLIWGKLTTFFQIVFIMWVFTCYFFGWEPYRTYFAFLILLALFSLLSLLQYIKLGVLYISQQFKN